MPRKPRVKSDTGVYHVMVRGLNRQNIFHDTMDFMKMERILRLAIAVKDGEGMSITPHCIIYAYCLMSNHIHLLIKEDNDEINIVMKRILVAYASYYNKKYNRIGPLFQGRYLSEPVNDEKYFLALLDYIHLNPVEAHIVRHPKDYEWSSWREYELDAEAASAGVSVQQNPFNNSVSREEMCSIALGLTAEKIIENEDGKLKDYEAVTILQMLLPPGVDRMSMKLQPLPIKRTIFKEAISRGIGIRQLSRITDIHLSSISRLLYAKHGDGSSVSRLVAETEEPSPLGGG